MTAAGSPAEGIVISGFQIPGSAWTAVRRLAAELAARPGRLYPWTGLEAELAGRPLTLVGYGSLMNAASAAQTLRPSTCRPVVAFGARRVFSYAMPDRSLDRYSRPADPHARAALNVYRSADPADAINGVCLDVDPADIPALRAREIDYHLFPVACLWWDRPADAPFIAHVLSAPDTPDGPAQSDDRLRPHADYYRLCRAGAASYSEAFLAFYLDRTFLADRRTTARAWEAAGGT